MRIKKRIFGPPKCAKKSIFFPSLVFMRNLSVRSDRVCVVMRTSGKSLLLCCSGGHLRRYATGKPKQRVLGVLRTPIQWKHPEYYNEESFEKEFRRVLDVCHGCRRCFNLCDAFPKLFDAVDSSASGELASVPTSALHPVNAECTLCDLCFTSKCPYTPPHEFNIDFPHLILRYRAIESASENQSHVGPTMESGKWLDDSHCNDKIDVEANVDRTLTKHPPRKLYRVMANQDTLGRLATGPVRAAATNAVTQSGPHTITRKLLQSVSGVDSRAALPEFAAQTFMSWFAKASATRPRSGECKRKVLVYVTCFVNHNRPEIGKAAVALLWASGVHVEVSFTEW
jgi:glycerol-3-phosphate dehydrogenase subunit C